jgi:hypothetical protein
MVCAHIGQILEIGLAPVAHDEEDDDEDEDDDESNDICFKCGQHGHWAKDCHRFR